MMNKEIIDKIRFFHKLLNEGKYASSNDVTNTYNIVFNKKLTNTNCGSCIRRRILDMVNELEKIERASKNE